VTVNEAVSTSAALAGSGVERFDHFLLEGSGKERGVSGTTSGGAGSTFTFSAAGATSSAGHAVQYYFNWGDGTDSGWLPAGTVSAAHAWPAAGSYGVTAQARCAAHSSVDSAPSLPLAVVVSPPDFGLTERNRGSDPDRKYRYVYRDSIRSQRI
jgi:hypothetical protein